MTRSIIIHVDGSWVRNKKFAGQSFGWGIVAQHDDQHSESFGGFLLGTKDCSLIGDHEKIAFVEGVLYVHSLGIDFSMAHFVTDDASIGYAPFHLHPENYRLDIGLHTLDTFKLLCKKRYDPQTFQLVVEALTTARITKVKGHAQNVYQERADYLAKNSAREMLGARRAEMLGYDAWLERGLPYYELQEVLALPPVEEWLVEGPPVPVLTEQRVKLYKIHPFIEQGERT